MEIQWIDEVRSTNTYIKEHPAAVESMTMLCAHSQTAGRGQRGNSWEATPGRNLTFSFHFHPEGVAPAAQFVISEAVALAMVDLLGRYGIEARVKWPNDIYVADRKIAGILIEHSLSAHEIIRTIAGVGLNVNQKEFMSDAPNPVSMTQLTKEGYDLQQIALTAAEALEARLGRLITSEGRRRLHAEFMRRLWRGDGECYPWRDRATGHCFRARIADVAPDGMLSLEPEEGGSGTRRTYAFKEVEAIL